MAEGFTRWMRSPSGLLQPMTAIRVDGPLTKAYLTAFSAKLAMALYREHIGAPLPLDGGVRLAFFLNAGLSPKAGDAMLEKLPVPGTLRQGKFTVPEQFAYRFNHDGKSIIAALAGFNSNLHMLMVATSNPGFYDFPQFAKQLFFHSAWGDKGPDTSQGNRSKPAARHVAARYLTAR
jgi:hypothetical protein